MIDCEISAENKTIHKNPLELCLIKMLRLTIITVQVLQAQIETFNNSSSSENYQTFTRCALKTLSLHQIKESYSIVNRTKTTQKLPLTELR